MSEPTPLPETLPPAVAQELLQLKKALSFGDWAFLRDAFTRARVSFSAEHALRVAKSALRTRAV